MNLAENEIIIRVEDLDWVLEFVDDLMGEKVMIPTDAEKYDRLQAILRSSNCRNIPGTHEYMRVTPCDE